MTFATIVCFIVFVIAVVIALNSALSRHYGTACVALVLAVVFGMIAIGADPVACSAGC